MSERRTMAVLVVLLVVVVGALTWAVTGPRDSHCVVVQLGSSSLPKGEIAQTCGGWFGYSPLAPDRGPRIVPVTKHGPVEGTVVRWSDEEGRGVLASPAVHGEVWAHFSSISGAGYKALSAGQPVTFTYETPGQDGFPHRAILIRAR